MRCVQNAPIINTEIKGYFLIKIKSSSWKEKAAGFAFELLMRKRQYSTKKSRIWIVNISNYTQQAENYIWACWQETLICCSEQSPYILLCDGGVFLVFTEALWLFSDLSINICFTNCLIRENLWSCWNQWMLRWKAAGEEGWWEKVVKRKTKSKQRGDKKRRRRRMIYDVEEKRKAELGENEGNKEKD